MLESQRSFWFFEYGACTAFQDHQRETLALPKFDGTRPTRNPLIDLIKTTVRALDDKLKEG